VFLKVEPDFMEREVDDAESPGASTRLAPTGFRLSEHSIQPPRTFLVDIGDEDSCILGRMKQKTRYNIRLAQKKGIVVSTSADLDTFHRLMQNTGQRDRFPVHSQAYYQSAYEIFHPIGQCELFQAEYDGQPIACLMAFARSQRAWYFYGASANVHRDLMPAYLLQWEAMRWARTQGCRIYDLWGVPDHEFDFLESQFSNRSGGLWGVYRFKRGFGGLLRRAVGPWDRVYHPLLYNFYRIWMQVRISRNEHAG
jgi:lipid II:glycine glycyltransferase (peptidoglycan interpeptide bridge formation enzyme)